MKLTKYEKETIILFHEVEDTASIYTFHAGLRKRLASFSRKHPDLCRLEKSFDQGGVSYVLDKSRLSIAFCPLLLPANRKRGRSRANWPRSRKKNTAAARKVIAYKGLGRALDEQKPLYRKDRAIFVFLHGWGREAPLAGLRHLFAQGLPQRGFLEYLIVFPR